MKMRTRVVAATLALGLVGGATVASGADAQAPHRTVALATHSSTLAATASAPALGQGASTPASTAALRNRVGLRAVKPCVYRGTPTRCIIRVQRFERRNNRVVAVGTITPRSHRSTHIPFHKRVIGVRTADGFFGFQAPQQAAPPSCAILNLVLGPLHLDLLGLVIDLNRVVLNITGQTGAGNLLGNLLCALTGILDGGVVLTRFLSVLNQILAALNSVLAL
jgi:hypothetical protein